MAKANERTLMNFRLEIARNALIDAADFIALKITDDTSQTKEFIAKLRLAISASSMLNTFKAEVTQHVEAKDE